MTTNIITGNPISKEDAIEQINNWQEYRDNFTLVKQLFIDSGYNFIISPNFSPEKFEDKKAHAYFGVHCYFEEGTGMVLRLNLLLIPEEEDVPDMEEPYIYCAPFSRQGFVMPGKDKCDPSEEDLVELEENWADGGENWLYSMVNSEDGMTLVSDVPFADIDLTEESEDGLYVFFGLREEVNGEIHKQLSLLFFDGNSDNFIHLHGADFTTPKPPFGTDLAKYSLLESTGS
ncbi:MAG: hypothetical protein ACPF9D_00215 [Owenweeksia sp.]